VLICLGEKGGRLKMSYGEFLQIQGLGTRTLWKRVPLGETAGRDEAWLRDTLRDTPELIPVADIDPSFGPLIPVCTELRTPAGPIDVVYVDRHGRLTVVECKLWRNPEARRKVVSQVLDYAKELTTWSYADLQRQVSARTRRTGNVLYELVRDRHPEVQEAWFADAAARALAAGRFLLLVVGDGIREDVRALGELINRNAASGFSFGMVEIALYQGLSDELLLQPRPLLRTQLIERTVVLLQNGAIRETVEGPEPADEEGGSIDPIRKAQTAEMRSWWAPVLEAPMEDPEQPAFQYRHPSHVRAPLPWPGTWIIAYRSTAGTPPSVGVLVSGREVPLAELRRALLPDSEEILLRLPEGSFFDDTGLGIRRRLDSFPDDDARRDWLITTLNQFVNELRPRISRLREAQES
jgi:hypothetical protein